MGTNEIARGLIKIDLDDEAAIAQLRSINQEFDRTMRDIDRAKASPDIDLSLAEYKDKIAAVKRELKQLDADKATPEVGLSDEDYKKQAAKLRADIKRLEGEKATIEVDLKGDEAVRKRLEKLRALEEKRRREEERWLNRLIRLEEQAEKRRLAGVHKHARVSAALRRQREQELSRAHAWALRINKELDRETVLVPRLQREYADLGRLLDKLRVARRRAFGDSFELARIDFREKEAVAKMKLIQRQLEAAGGPIDLDIVLHPGRDFGRRLRQRILDNNALKGDWTRASTAIGLIVADHFARGFFNGVRNRFTRTALTGMATRTLGRVGDILEGISNMTVRIGPFTATLRKLGIALTALGPMLFDLVGAFGALIGVTGAALSGAATVGLSAVTGLSLGLVGLLISARNTGQEVQQARTSIDALQAAQLKHGRSSDQAKKKQKELNNVLRQISPLARETALGIERFYTRWDKRTSETRSSLGTLAQTGFRALDKITPAWAARTNRMSRIFRDELGSAFEYVSGTARQQIFGKSGIMGLFNQALPTLLRGLGKFGAGFINLAQEGARHLPRAFAAFDRLGKSFLRFTRSENFSETIQRWVDSAADLGKFLSAAGRMLTSFFGAGVASGRRFLGVMTDALDKWDRFLRSPEGNRATAKWFDNAVDGARALWNALQPIATTFFLWASSLSPVFTEFLKGAAAIGGAVAQLIKLVGLQGPLGTLVATLGALWAVGKISAATRAVTGFTMALLGLKTAQAAVARGAGGAAAAAALTGGVARGGTTVVPMAAPRQHFSAAQVARQQHTQAAALSRVQAASAAMTARQAAATGRLAVAGTAARGALAGLAGVVGFSNPIIGGAILAAGGLYAAHRLLTKGSREAKKALQENTEVALSARESYLQNTDSLADTSAAHRQAAIDVRSAKKALAEAKEGTDEYKQAQLNLEFAERQKLLTYDRVREMNKDRRQAAEDNVQAELNRLDSLDKLQKKEREQLDYWSQEGFKGTVEYAEAQRRLAILDDERAKKVDDVNRALNAQAAVTANTRRATAGMVPVLGAAEQKLGALGRLSRTAAVKVALKFESPKDVGRVSASAAASLRAGVPVKIVTRIVADSKTAEEAVKRLAAARITDKKFDIIAKGGIGAVRTLEQIAGRKLADKEFAAVMRGGKESLLVLAKILGIKLGTKTQRIQQTGASDVEGSLRSIIGLKQTAGRTTTSKIKVDASGAFGPLSSVRSQLSQIPTSKTVRVNVVTNSVTGKAYPRNARGRGADGSQVSWVGEGRDFRGARELIANQRTGQVKEVNEPTIMRLDKDDYVIPTEAAFAARGRRLFSEWARNLGIPMFRQSKRPKSKKIVRGVNPEKIPAVAKYKKYQDEEDELNKKISIAERRVREPDTFLKPNGVDPEGNTTYAIDQSAVDTYRAQVEEVRKLQAQLVTTDQPPFGGLMGKMISQANKVKTALKTYRSRRNSNISTANASITANEKLLKSKDKDTVKKAQERIKKDKDLIKSEKDLVKDSFSVGKDIADDARDIEISRGPGYGIDLQDTVATKAGIDTLANKQLAIDNPSPKEPDVAPEVGERGAPTVSEDRIGRLETEKALAQIGIGVNGQPPRSIEDINADLLAANQARMDEGLAMLRNDTTSDDAEAYSIIQSAASAISSLRDEIKQAGEASQQTAEGVIAQQTAFSTSMLDLYRNMGSNFTSTAASAAVAAVSKPVGFGALSTATPGGGIPGTPTGPGGSGIVINQTFPAQPDPLTWAASTRYELNAAL